MLKLYLFFHSTKIFIKALYKCHFYCNLGKNNQERKDEIKLEQKNSQQRKDDTPMSSQQLVVFTGIFGALIWGGMHGALYFFHFSQVSLYSVKGWFGIGKLENVWANFAVTVVLVCLISLLISYIYYYTLRKKNHFGIFLGFGAVLFFITFVVLQPLNKSLPPITTLDMETNVTNFCIFLLYGVFVAYTISYDYAQQQYLEKRAKKMELQKD